MASTRTNKISDAGRERAVSEVIGAIMLISVVVVAVAVLGVALTSQGTPQKIPVLDAVISNYGRTIQIYHNGGDTLQNAEMAVLVDGTEIPFAKGTNPTWTSWSAGESLVYNIPGTGDMPDIVRIVYKGGGTTTVLTTADFSATGMINDGPLPTPTPDVGPVKASFTGTPVSGTAPLAVQFTGSSTGTPTSWSWAFGDLGTSTLQSPLYTYANAGTFTVSLTVSNGTGSDTQTRTNYITVSSAGPIANFVGNPPSGSAPLTVYFTDISTGTPTSWLWEFGDGATDTLQHPSHIYPFTGVYTVNLTATNAGGSNKTSKAGYISTSLSAPTVTAISPSSSLQITPVSVAVAGTGFLSGANVTLVKAGQTDRIATSVSVVSGNLINCQFNLATAAVGLWDVKVNNTNGQSGTLAAGFTVKNPTPTITAALSPATGARGWMTGPITITGTNFKPGAIVRLVNLTAGPDIVNATPVINGPGTQIICTFNLIGQPGGVRNVTVTNPYSDPGVRANGFTITSNAPTVTAITPNINVSGWTVSITNLAGTNFQNDATTVKLVNATAGPDITATNVVMVSATRITCTFDLTGAPAARRSVTVTNSDGKTGTFANGFTITDPTLTARNPATGNRGWPVAIILLTGTGFKPGADVRLQRSGYSDVVATGVNVASYTSINAGTFNLLGVTAGTWNIVIINPDGKRSNTMTFTVNSLAPTFSSINPNTAARGSTVSIINLAGGNFQPNAKVQLQNATRVISIASGVNVAAANSINAGQFTIGTSGVRPGTYSVNITNTDGQIVVSAVTVFTVT